MVQVRRNDVRETSRETSVDTRARQGRRWSKAPANLRVAHIGHLEKQLERKRVEFDRTSAAEAAEGDSWVERNSESYDGVAEDEPLDIDGFLLKKSGAFSGTKRRYFVLKGGTLLWYKSEKDGTAAGFLHLADCIAISEYSGKANVGGYARSPGETRRDSARTGCTILLRTTKDFLLTADDEMERDRWLRSLRHNQGLPQLAALVGAVAASTKRSHRTISVVDSVRDLEGEEEDATVAAATSAPASSEPRKVSFESLKGSLASMKSTKSSKTRSMLSNLALRVEKSMAGRAVTSDLGKKILREYCQPETFTLLQAMRGLASADPRVPPKQGQLIEDTLLRTAVKMALLHRHGRLCPDDFDPLVRVVDTTCIDMVRKYDSMREPPVGVDRLDPKHAFLGTQMQKLDEELCRLLMPHISEKNVTAMSGVVNYFGKPDNIAHFMTEPQCASPLEQICASLRTIYGLNYT
jgi:hypothetical protein